MSRLRILFIDDNMNSVGPAMKWVKETRECDCIPFTNFEEEIEARQPHVVIIDRFEGTPTEGTDRGGEVFDVIWSRRFCPVVIYSAFPDPDTDERKQHPFVKHVKKAADLQDFKTAFNALVGHAQAIDEAEKHIRQQFAVAMREVAPYAATVCTNPSEYNEAVTRHGRRRMAALMDQFSQGPLRVWEQYLHPPVSTDTKLGDIIRASDGSPDDPKAFRVVLTPSCDMVTGQTNRADHILVARCVRNEAGLEMLGIAGAKAGKIRSYLLTAGHRDGILPLPQLRGRIPSMMADLKKLELLPPSSIGDDKPYQRIASIDSPFRELVAWAYLNVACRLGLPNREFDAWATEIAPPKTTGTKQDEADGV